MGNGFTELQREALTKVQCENHEENQSKVNRRMKIDAGQVLASDRPVNSLPNHPGKNRELEAARKCKNKQPIAPGGVRLRIRRDPANELKFQRRAVFLPVFEITKPGYGFARIVEAGRIRSSW